MADLITLIIVLVFFWLLHSLTEAVRGRRTRRSHSVLSRLGYDPEQHELEVTVVGGCKVTGRADTSSSSPFQDGVLLTHARQTGEATLPGTITFIPARNIMSVAIRDRTDR